MIEILAWGTPNGIKPLIMLEEVGLEYRLRPVNIGEGEQKTPEFLTINPNGKIPAVIDDDGAERVVLFESGAILVHLAQKTELLWSRDVAGRLRILQWLMFQISSIGPMFGQLGAFSRLPHPTSTQRRNSERKASGF